MSPLTTTELIASADECVSDIEQNMQQPEAGPKPSQDAAF